MPDPSSTVAPRTPAIDPADAARVGRTIAEKYRVVRVLGAGGMGAVYEAENSWTGRRVAIKVLRASVAASDEAVRRFRQEAQATTAIAHPNIVDVLDMGREPDGALFIVQEYLDGSDLRGLLDARGHLALREAVEILVPIMDALVAAHDRGVVHRDIKPENIFLARTAAGDAVPKLIDFGVSKFSGPDGVSLSMTRTGTAIGTPYYMSPEQARGDVELDVRTDVWSLGAVAFEMLAGRAPYDAPNYNLLITKIITEGVPRLDAYAPELPADVVAVVSGALTKDRAARYATMRAFRDALLACAVVGEQPLLHAGTGRFRYTPGEGARAVSGAALPVAVLPASDALSAATLFEVPPEPAAAPAPAPSLTHARPWLGAFVALAVIASVSLFVIHRAIHAHAPAAPTPALASPPPAPRAAPLPAPPPVVAVPTPAVDPPALPTTSSSPPSPPRVANPARGAHAPHPRPIAGSPLVPINHYQ